MRRAAGARLRLGGACRRRVRSLSSHACFARRGKKSRHSFTPHPLSKMRVISLFTTKDAAASSVKAGRRATFINEGAFIISNVYVG